MWMVPLCQKREVKQREPGLPHEADKAHAVRQLCAGLLITYSFGCLSTVCAHAFIADSVRSL